VWAKLAAEHPEVDEYHVRLGGTYGMLARLAAESGQPATALARGASAAKALEVVRRRAPKHAQARRFLRDVYWDRAKLLSRLGRPAEALPDWDRALEMDDGRARLDLRLHRTRDLAVTGAHARPAAEADELVRDRALSATGLYNLACVWALASAAAQGDAKLAEADRVRLAERHAARAVELLTRAQAQGYFKGAKEVGGMSEDTDLGSLRPRADFQRLVEGLRAKGK
jgi:tetratricopeptide (TPR) repeat protein